MRLVNTVNAANTVKLVKIFSLVYVLLGFVICTQLKAGKAHAFQGTPIATCSDNINATDPFRVINTVEADTSRPEYMMLKFISTQNQYPFTGIVTVKWHNLSNSREGTFQLQRIDNHYNIAAVQTGPGLVALAVIFNNSLNVTTIRTLPAAQCNAQIDIISSTHTDEIGDIAPDGTVAPNDPKPDTSIASNNPIPENNSGIVNHAARSYPHRISSVQHGSKNTLHHHSNQKTRDHHFSR